MLLRRLPIAELKPAPYNPRVALAPGTPAWRRLERSLAEFDLVEPIVWNERTGHVVGGHQRLAVLAHRGETEVDVSVVSLPLEKEQALNVALNNQNLAGDWDAEKLVELLKELEDTPEFDATLTGFDADELNDLLLEPLPEVADVARPGWQPADCDLQDEEPLVRVTLEVPSEQWSDVQPDVDALVAKHGLRVHVSGGE